MDYTTQFNVPMSQPDITEMEREAVAHVMRTNSLSMGPYIREFEAEISAFTGAKHAVAVNSGTAGLHCCVRAAGWQDGDWVITSPFSFVASANVLLFERITPIFVDVDPLTGNLDAEQTLSAMRELTESRQAAKKWLPACGFHPDGKLKGLIPVDVFGQPFDFDKVVSPAHDLRLTVIEDSCEALGANYQNRAAGTLGDFGVFAFYPNKQITTGEGGMIITHDDRHADMLRALRNQGRAPHDTWLEHTHLGYNYRMSELSAALGAIQMKRIEEILAKRQLRADWYAEELSAADGIELPHTAPTTTRNSWFVYVIRLAPTLNRDDVITKLAALGIPARPYFSPIHLQPYMRKRFGYEKGQFPVTEDLGKRGLALPFSGVMTREQIGMVGQALRQII